MREAVFSDLAEACPWTRQLYASPESLSSTFISAASNPSNFFASSSKAVVMVASNLVGFRGTSSWAPRNRAAFLF